MTKIIKYLHENHDSMNEIMSGIAKFFIKLHLISLLF